jgi:hypothetical protein
MLKYKLDGLPLKGSYADTSSGEGEDKPKGGTEGKQSVWQRCKPQQLTMVACAW